MGDEEAKKGRGTTIPPRAASTQPPPPPQRASTRPPPRASARPPARLSNAALRLSSIDFDLVNATRRIVENALGVVPGERVVLVLDEARRDLAQSLVTATEILGAVPVAFELEQCVTRPARRVPQPIEEALATAQASVFLCGLDDGEIGMRADLVACVKKHLLRHAHMPGITRRSLIAGFSVDPTRILDATRAVRTRMRPDSVLKLRTPAGSDLEVRISPAMRWVEHVGVIRPGRWENLPSGELLTCPGDVRGVFVADASIGGRIGQDTGLLTTSPVRVEIEGGYCKSVRTHDLALQRSIEDAMRREHNLDRVGLIVLGTNVGIGAPVGEALCDQNLPGLHLSFGSTFAEYTGATWTARGQLPMTCAGADVDLDGAPLLRSGRYMVG